MEKALAYKKKKKKENSNVLMLMNDVVHIYSFEFIIGSPLRQQRVACVLALCLSFWCTKQNAQYYYSYSSAYVEPDHR